MRKQPELFFEHILGVTTLEPYQKSLIQDIADHDQVAVAACHSSSKTYTLGRIALWFLYCFKDSIVISTAPTHRQVEALLWGEIRDAYKNAKYPLGGHLTQKSLHISDKHYALGFSPQKEAAGEREQKGSSLQGFHSDNMLLIFDEATGIPPDMWKMAEGILTSGNVVKFVCIANPTTKNCEFHKLFSYADWHNVYLSCFDSPNLKANGFTNLESIENELDKLKVLPDRLRLKRISEYKKPITYLLSAQWVIKNALKWGVHHPLFLSKALGKFPEDSEDTIIKSSNVQKAMDRDAEVDKELDYRYVGVDVARYGDDLSVITDLIGFKQVGLVSCAKRDINELSGIVLNVLKDGDYWRNTLLLIDGTGLGAGLVDNLREIQYNNHIGDHIDIREVNYGASCETDEDKQNYFNLKARIFDLLNKDLEKNLDILDQEAYCKQLSSILYSYTGKGQVKIESKEDFKKRTGDQSPDHADSLSIANFGRHIEQGVGSFKGFTSSEMVVKTTSDNKTFKKLGKRIKPREY